MFKTRFISILALLLMAVSGAWATITVTWNSNDITGSGNSFTKDGVTITAGMIDFDQKNFMMDGTFTTTLGNFTKIEVTAYNVDAVSGTGWSGSSTKKTWTGNASSVSFSGMIMGSVKMGGNIKFEFTIEPATDVTGLTLSQTEAAMTVGGDALTLTATVAPANATNKTVTWTTSNASVATVANGVVTAVGAGTATITATATNGTAATSDDKTATCTVTVTVPVSGVTLSQTEAALNISETLTLTATIAPGNATDKTVTWTTSNASVATVANGVVTAVAPGTATITATATNGTADTSDDKTATCTVTVSPAGYSVSLKSGTEDATSWQGKAGTDDYQELPLTGLEAGTAVSVKYNGTKKVKSVKAKKKQ